MDAPGWLSQPLAEVPARDDWLGENERQVLAGLRFERRRQDWRLGRWTARRAVSAWLGAPFDGVEILAGADGAPQAWLQGRLLPVSVSLSHRAGRGLAVVSDLPQVSGCDLEVTEPRSAAFIREWLSLDEQRRISGCPEEQRPVVANLIWTAKEAGAKVRREGLRLDVRDATVAVDADGPEDGWRTFEVRWRDGAATTRGWWCTEPGWVMAIASHPRSGVPRALGAPTGMF